MMRTIARMLPRIAAYVWPSREDEGGTRATWPVVTELPSYVKESTHRNWDMASALA